MKTESSQVSGQKSTHLFFLPVCIILSLLRLSIVQILNSITELDPDTSKKLQSEVRMQKINELQTQCDLHESSLILKWLFSSVEPKRPLYLVFFWGGSIFMDWKKCIYKFFIHHMFLPYRYCIFITLKNNFTKATWRTDESSAQNQIHFVKDSCPIVKIIMPKTC